MKKLKDIWLRLTGIFLKVFYKKLKQSQGDQGNTYFVSPTHRALALVEFPNIGKSTVISRVSVAKLKIADYHFTTSAPNLGMVKVMMAGCFDILAGKVFRLGHMGENANVEDVALMLDALDHTFADLGYPLQASMKEVFVQEMQ